MNDDYFREALKRFKIITYRDDLEARTANDLLYKPLPRDLMAYKERAHLAFEALLDRKIVPSDIQLRDTNTNQFHNMYVVC